MDARGLVASVIGSLAWPATVLVLVGVFRTPLGTLLGNIRQATLGSVVLDFRERLGDLENELPPDAHGGDLASRVRRAPPANNSPADIVEAAWNRLERALQALSERRGLGDARGPDRSAELLAGKVISPETYDQVRQLRDLRRSVSRRPEAFTTEDAIRFEAAASEVQQKIPPA